VFHFLDEVEGKISQHLQAPIRTNPDRVFQPTSHPLIRIVKSRLNGRHDTGIKSVPVRCPAAETRAFVDVQPQTMPQAVDIAIFELAVLPDRIVS